jgi:acyl-coenzyme A thioesterase PaaI-like protein
MNDQVKLDEIAPALSAKEAETMITTNLPPIDHHGEIVEQVGRNCIRVRLPYDRKFMGTEPWQDGSGQVFSGPMVMGFADTAMYCCVMAAMGASVIPVMANLNITFLRPRGRPDRRGAHRSTWRPAALSGMLAHVGRRGRALCAHHIDLSRIETLVFV